MELLIIKGTTKHCDLIPAFFRELLRQDESEGTKLFYVYGQTIRDTFEAHEDHQLKSPFFVRIDLIIELMHRIDAYAKAGFYFGSRTSNINEFGYWPIEQ